MPTSPTCLTARAKLAHYVAGLGESTATEKAVGIIKTGFLSPKTILKKTAGDIVLAGVENLVTRPLAVGIDYLASVARSAATFGERSPAEFRELTNVLSPTGIRFGARGFREGLAKSIAILKTGVDADHLTQRFDLQRLRYKNPIIQAVTDGVYNTLHATIKPWYGLAFNLSLYARAAANAVREGLTGAAKTARIDELLATPTDEMAIGAANDAEYATLTNTTALGEAATRLKTGLKRASENPANNTAKRVSAQVGYVGSELSFPFTGVPTAIGGVLVDYSPIGAAKTIGMMVKALGKDAPIEPQFQAKLALGAARSIVGSAGLLGIGYALGRKGLLTGSYPTNPNERARWQAEGKQPYSFYHDGQWHSLTGMAPLGLAPLIGADVAHYVDRAEERGQSVSGTDLAAQAAGSMGKTLTQQSFLQGVSAITDALTDPQQSAARTAAQLMTSPVPTVARQIAHGVSPTLRQSTGFLGQLKANVPGLDQTLPPRVDQLGRTQTRGAGGVAGILRELLDITNTRPETTTPALTELERLGVGLPSFSHALNMPHAPHQTLSPEQYNDALHEFGPLKEAILEHIMTSPEYRVLSDEQKRGVLTRTLQQVQHSGTSIVKARQMGYNVPPVTLRDYLGPNTPP